MEPLIIQQGVATFNQDLKVMNTCEIYPKKGFIIMDLIEV